MKDLGRRFAETPEAARRPLPFRNAYQAHPFVLAAIPVVAGVLVWSAGIGFKVGLLDVVGAGIAAFGCFIEFLNVIDWAWRARRRRSG